MTTPENPTRAILSALLSGLYVITDERAAEQESVANHERITRAAIAGGARIIQLRAKRTPPEELARVGHVLRRLTSEAGVLLLVNDRVDLAAAIDADGVHLGPDDLSPREARRLLGAAKVIGVSCGDETEAREAFQSSADYIGAGAIFSTATKLDAGAPIGLATLRAIVQATPLPVAAIGGIDADNIASVGECGARMACVISAVTRARDEDAMAAAVRRLQEKFTSAAKWPT